MVGDGEFIYKRYFSDPALYVREILKVEPDVWQAEILDLVHKESKIAVASGHGIGKTALTSWIIHWFISTRVNPQIICTANTKQQLDTKTWRELAKWNQKALNGDWFKWSATKFAMKSAEATWFASAIPWSEQNPEAFAGTHEENVLVLFDEASAIPDSIWEVVEGAMTTAGAKWIAFGNPTRNTGRFRACFGRYKHRWVTRQIDSRTAKMTDKAQIQQWADDYGDDSDFFRVRVKGEFPRTGSRQFISSELVEDATKRKVVVPYGTSKIIAVDVARFGDDQSVIARRHGRKLEELIKFRGLDTMALASEVINIIKKTKPDATFVDGVGVGGGCIDRIRSLGYQVIDVNASKAPDRENKDTHFNKRVEMWDRMKIWLEGADIPDDRDLYDELIGIEYGFDNKMRLQLEKKEDMKKRGLSSPDCADALAMSFYQNVMPAVDEQSLEPEIFYDT